MTRWAVVGSRGFTDPRMLSDVLAVRVASGDIVVSGGAFGPDSWAEEWARRRHIKTLIFSVDWSKGRGAGMARNTTIVENCDVVLAFWDGKSRGTADTIAKAEKAGKPVHVFTSSLVASLSEQEGKE